MIRSIARNALTVAMQPAGTLGESERTAAASIMIGAARHKAGSA
jgi:hypothetical protein